MRALFFHYSGQKTVVQCMLCLFVILLCSAVSVAEGAQGRLYDDLFSVTFPSEKDGWACGRWGTVLHTMDGGATWARQQTGTENTLAAIHFVDTKNGWAVGDGGTIIRTADGGKTWQKQKSPVPYFLMGVHFVSPAKGFIVTERTHILSTENGGDTWNIQFKDEDFILKALSFCDTQNGWTVGEFGYIYRTKDGGATWQKQAGFSDLSEETGELIGGTYIFGVVAVDPNTAWAVGINGYVARTTDGGKTWPQIEVKNMKTTLFGVAAGKGSIVAVGKGGAIGTEDNGKTWKKLDLKPPLPYSWLYGVTTRASGGFAAAGKEGAIYFGSSNGWQQVILQTATAGDSKRR